MTTYESFVHAASKSQKETLISESRDIDQKSVSAFRESSSGLQSALSDVPVDAAFVGCLPILQIINLIV